jgi:pyruvate dehydrogenase E2 component (dihydrolipoamide acetyltransferase)
MSAFNLPDLGEGLTEAELVAWHVGAGDHVVAGQPLVSVETDKAVVEIPSPRAGRIARLHGKPGDIVAVGAPLVEFGEGRQADAGSVVGTMPQSPGAPAGASTAPRPNERAAPSPGRVRAAPAVRALAQKLGVDLAEVAGSGPGGAILSADVETAAGGAVSRAGAVEPLRGVRRAMARNMARAHAEVVPATVTETADNASWLPGTDVTVRLLRALAVAAAAEPALNATWLGFDQGRRLNERVDIGIATDTPDGLFVPVMRDVGNRDAADLRRGLEHLKADVRARSIPPGELRGATITLSNFGMFGGRHAALVVVPPQVAIVGAGRIRDAVVAREGSVAIRRVLPLSLTFDHRAAMGGEAARFLATLVADLESGT